MLRCAVVLIEDGRDADANGPAQYRTVEAT